MLRRFGWRGVVRLAGIGVFVLLVAWAHAATTPAEPGFRNGLSRETGQNAANQPLDMSDYDRLLRSYVNDNGWVLADALDTVYGKRYGVQQVDGFFDKRKHFVGGEQLTLDKIEKRGRDLHDPRIHFAIVCASTSCPRLQRSAFRAEKLDAQLDQAARGFLADTKRGLRYDPSHNDLYISPIFKWYAGDFTGSEGSLWARAKATVSGSEILDVIVRYAPEEVGRRIREHPPALHYFDYDWSLNSLETHSAGSKR